MSVVIQVLGLVNGQSMHGMEGSWVKSYTPDGHGGRGDLELTGNLERAARYEDGVTAMREWRRVSRTHPTRPSDGRPNRPMTAFTVEMYDPDKRKGK